MDGENDGLVTAASARWGNYCGTWRGLSHIDLVDGRRRELSDVREAYIKIAEELKGMGF